MATVNMGQKAICSCSPDCNSETGGTFAPGHDARMVSRLTKAVLDGLLTSDEALHSIEANGGTDALVDKARKIIEKKVLEMTARQRREAVKALAHLVGTDIQVYHGKRKFGAQVVETADGVIARHRSIGRGTGWCYHDPATGELLDN